jgi:hypothetical protein
MGLILGSNPILLFGFLYFFGSSVISVFGYVGLIQQIIYILRVPLIFGSVTFSTTLRLLYGSCAVLVLSAVICWVSGKIAFAWWLD